jgi:hypothetical protein
MVLLPQHRLLYFFPEPHGHALRQSVERNLNSSQGRHGFFAPQ